MTLGRRNTEIKGGSDVSTWEVRVHALSSATPGECHN